MSKPPQGMPDKIGISLSADREERGGTGLLQKYSYRIKVSLFYEDVNTEGCISEGCTKHCTMALTISHLIQLQRVLLIKESYSSQMWWRTRSVLYSSSIIALCWELTAFKQWSLPVTTNVITGTICVLHLNDSGGKSSRHKLSCANLGPYWRLWT